MNKKDIFMECYYDGIFKLTGASKEQVSEYYDESIYSGYPSQEGGSVWESEGKSIYVLIRILKPQKILEIGNYLGNSSNHILQAVDKNGFGEVNLLDIEDRLDYNRLYSKNFNRIISDSIKWLSNPFDIDFIIQDGNHTYTHVKNEISLILNNNRRREYYVWSHDYYVNKPESQVGKALDEVKHKFTKFHTFIDNFSNCGFSIAYKHV